MDNGQTAFTRSPNNYNEKAFNSCYYYQQIRSLRTVLTIHAKSICVPRNKTSNEIFRNEKAKIGNDKAFLKRKKKTKNEAIQQVFFLGKGQRKSY